MKQVLIPLPNSDETLPGCARGGDRAAAGEIVRRYYPRVHSIAFRMLQDAEAAGDATQETFVRALSNLDQFNPAYKLSAWLFKILVNFIRDDARHRGRVIALDLEPAESSMAALPPLDRAARDEDLARIRAEISALPEGQRLAFLLHFQEGLNEREVGYAMEVSYQAARLKICRAAARLRARLKETP